MQEVFGGDKQVQGLDWALLDIFAPFRPSTTARNMSLAAFGLHG